VLHFCSSFFCQNLFLGTNADDNELELAALEAYCSLTEP